MTVVITTIITIGPKRLLLISPRFSPLSATISATSPRDIMPTPICRASLLEYLHSFAPSPQPNTFVIIATTSRTTANSIIIGVISVSVTLRPMLAKKMGDNSRYDIVSNLCAMYFVLDVLEMTRPATNEPVISATPKNSSAAYAKIRHRAKLTIT